MVIGTVVAAGVVAIGVVAGPVVVGAGVVVTVRSESNGQFDLVIS